MRALVLILAIFVVSCGKEPRAATYFESDGEERARVLAACAKGATENGECAVAELAESRVTQTEKSERSDDALRESIARDRAKARGQEVR